MKKARDVMIKGMGIAGTILLLAAGVANWKTTVKKSGELAMAADIKQIRTEAETEYEETTESETMSETEEGTEHEETTESETMSETEEGTEHEETTESEIMSETEGDTEHEEETESEVMSETEEGTEHEEETESEVMSETEEGTEHEETTESETLSETEKETECEETENECATEAVSEIDTEYVTELPVETEKKELLPEYVERGKHYEVKGDTGAWYRDAQDNLWLRKGTNLYIETKQEGGYDGRGIGMKNLQSDGVMTFQLQKTDSDGKILAVSEICKEGFFVDGEAPEATILVEGTEKDGLFYQSQNALVQIRIPPDGKSGLKKAEYCIMSCLADGSPIQDASKTMWQSCENGKQILLQEEGLFTIYVRTQDQVGNQRFSQSAVLCIDHTPPELVIEGVGDQTANAEEVLIRVSCKDEHYRKGSLNIQLTGANAGKRPEIKEQEESEQGASVTYLDFPRIKLYDDVYRLEVTAEDLAGNQSKETLTFSINRFGSVYDLSDDTKKGLKQYYLSQPQAIVFYETNIDYVGESEILCRRDGELNRLRRGQDYQVVMQGSSSSWKQYQYVIPETYFSEEGIYELMLYSKDRAENESDTGQQEKRVVFVLDWTAPECSITGVRAGEIYDSEAVTVCMVPHDNFNIADMKIYKNSELLKTQKADNRETVRLRVEAEEQWQTLQVYLRDHSGNEYWSKEIPFYIRKNGEEVPIYEKLRESAEEKEKRKKLRKWTLLNRSSLTFTRNEVLDKLFQSRQKLELAAQKTEQQTVQMQEERLQQGEGENRSGRSLLTVGIAVFLLTTIVLLWLHFRLL